MVADHQVGKQEQGAGSAVSRLGESAGSCHLCQVVILWGDEILVGGLAEIIHLPCLKSAVGIASVALGELSSERFFCQ